MRDLAQNAKYRREGLKHIFTGQSAFMLVRAIPALRRNAGFRNRKLGLQNRPGLPVLGRREVGGRRAGGVVMGAPQIGDGPPPQTTGRERILPDMRYLGAF